jgi:translation initiation factor IF-3
MVGIVSLEKAIKQASLRGLELVDISPNAKPPVCKILDFSRFKYDSKKKQQEARKKHKKISLKEMKFKINIGQGDFNVKINKIRKFLEGGDKVKISLWFKGREIIHRDKGHTLFQKVIKSLGEVVKIDSEAKMEGKQIIMILSSNLP